VVQVTIDSPAAGTMADVTSCASGLCTVIHAAAATVWSWLLMDTHAYQVAVSNYKRVFMRVFIVITRSKGLLLFQPCFFIELCCSVIIKRSVLPVD
jgi:hypothetical protein